MIIVIVPTGIYDSDSVSNKLRQVTCPPKKEQHNLEIFFLSILGTVSFPVK